MRSDTARQDEKFLRMLHINPDIACELTPKQRTPDRVRALYAALDIKDDQILELQELAARRRWWVVLLSWVIALLLVAFVGLLVRESSTTPGLVSTPPVSSPILSPPAEYRALCSPAGVCRGGI